MLRSKYLMGYSPNSPQQRGAEFIDNISSLNVQRGLLVHFLFAPRILYASIHLLRALQPRSACWGTLSAHECMNLTVV